jgi:thiamine biosynthesis lipoprotein
MQNRFYLTVFRLAALLWSLAQVVPAHPAAAEPPASGRVHETRRHMGVAWTIVVYAVDNDQALAAVAAAHDEVARLERILSDYDPESELSQLSAQAPTRDPVPVSEDLWQVLDRAVAWRESSGGAFDPTVGPLTKLWRQARRSGKLPLPEKLTAARAAVGPDTLRLHPHNKACELTVWGMRLDLGGIGMGVAIDRAVAILREHGITAGMIDASGDIAVIGAPPDRDSWRVAVAALGLHEGDTAEIALRDAAVTTSGDAFQSVTIDGVRYSHIIDPRTGLGVTGPAAVTVIAPDCTTADALATAASVLGPTAGMRLVAATPGAAARFVWEEADGTRRECCSPDWPHCPGQAE